MDYRCFMHYCLKLSRPNPAAPVNASASWFHIGHPGRRVTEQWRSAALHTPMRFAPFLLCTFWLLTGCTRTVSYQQLQYEGTKRLGASFPDTTFYCGTKDGYDYFHIQPGIGSGGSDYRVAVAGSPHTNRFEFTSDRSLWLTVWPLPGLTQQQLQQRSADFARTSAPPQLQIRQ
jgi:hypothetical protein